MGKLRRADELAADGKTARRSPPNCRCRLATLYNWRRTYGGMDSDAAKKLKEWLHPLYRVHLVQSAIPLGRQILGVTDPA